METRLLQQASLLTCSTFVAFLVFKADDSGVPGTNLLMSSTVSFAFPAVALGLFGTVVSGSGSDIRHDW